MQTLLFILGILFILFVLIFFLIAIFFSLFKKKNTYSYVKRESLLDKNEKNFYKVLVEVLKDTNFVICPKVRMEDIISLPSNINQYSSEGVSKRNRIKSNHIDFLICEKENLKPVLAIELNGSSHNNYKRKQRDEFVDNAFQSANMPILWIEQNYTYNIEFIRKEIMEKINNTYI